MTAARRTPASPGLAAAVNDSPSLPAGITTAAREGAASVFRYIVREARPEGGGVTWRTLSTANESRCDPNLYNGVAGISLFLSDYFRVTGDPLARELAAGALRWCVAPERPPSMEPLGMHLPHSLYSGSAGMGLAWLRLALATADGAALDRAAALGERVASGPVGPWAEVGRGALGEGLFLLRLREATGDPRHLNGALRRGAWFRDTAIRDAHGCHWLRVTEVGNPRRHSLTGLHTGNAGIGHFCLTLGAATGEPAWTALAQEAADTLLGQARPGAPDDAGLDWPYAVGGADLARCQWCAGAPGIGYFLAEAGRALGSPAFLAAAQRAGETVFAHGDWRRNPSQCHGLAGSAELFRVLALGTGDAVWLERLQDFTLRTLAYRTAATTGAATGTVAATTPTTPEGESWQGDEPGYASPDYFCGAAGVGHFFLRLLAPETLHVPYL